TGPKVAGASCDRLAAAEAFVKTMDNAIYVGLSRQMTLRRELDIAANNMANVDTAGFKLEDLMLRPDPQARAKTSGVTSPVTVVISQAGQKVGQLDVVRFPDLSSLSKDGNNLFRNDTNVPPLPSTDAKLRQGALEGSNVQPIVQMTHLIDITRAYETITNLMS